MSDNGRQWFTGTELAVGLKPMQNITARFVIHFYIEYYFRAKS
jgi:hypothetical protein